MEAASGTSDEMPPQIQCSPSAVCKVNSHAPYSSRWLITRVPVIQTFPIARHPSKAPGSQMNPPMTEREAQLLVPGLQLGLPPWQLPPAQEPLLLTRGPRQSLP